MEQFLMSNMPWLLCEGSDVYMVVQGFNINAAKNLKQEQLLQISSQKSTVHLHSLRLSYTAAVVLIRNQKLYFVYVQFEIDATVVCD